MFMLLLAPMLILCAAGMVATRQSPPRAWTAAAGLALVSTIVWLVYVGLYQHETPCTGRTTTRCPTIYGYDAPLPDENGAGIALLLAGFAVPAAWAGWRRAVPPLAAGAALALVPTVLAGWTAPRGDNDGLWVLVFLALPVLGGHAAVVAAVAGRVARARRRSAAHDVALSAAAPSDRLAALIIDIAVVGGLLLAPLIALSRAKAEIVAAAVGLAVATACLALPVAWKGRSLGQSLVGLFLLDTRTNERVPVVRALARSAIVVVEVALVPTLIFAVPALIELIALALSRRTLTDRLFGTSVLSRGDGNGRS